MKPAWHYRPERNWINDPNGLVQLNGWYHLFYQYNPHGDQWGDIHWSHARSRDLLHWETMPIAMTPDAARGELMLSVQRQRENRINFSSLFFVTSQEEGVYRD